MLNWIKDLVFVFFPKWRFMNTYSQAGEDVIAAYFFFKQGIKKPTYLDIGTNHPIYGNNTFLFYKRGSSGVCIEADPSLIPAIIKSRPKDLVLSAGVTFDNNTEADFYLFDQPSHNTLSKEEAELREKEEGQKIKDIIRIPLLPINQVLQKHFAAGLDFLSLDVEGVDLQILKSIDFSIHRPALICVETITFSLDNQEQKIEEIATYMQTQNYAVYADTHINTLFVDQRYSASKSA